MYLSENEKLTVFRFCLTKGVITTDHIEKWAITTYLETGAQRTDYILELCSAKAMGLNDTLSFLKQNQRLDHKEEIKETICGIAGYLFRNNKISIEKAGEIIDFTTKEIDIETMTNTDFDYSYSIDDYIYLAYEGVLNIDDVKNQLLTNTKPYEKLGKEFLKEHFDLD
ncbi:hypothetical protein Q763_14645 [Flavobacterium beibuense F44-8]|uniref:Uncharacterized protein n=1 Tax=Flavobacterium beibuense F44-8 TaxID=1406840 RepID=A0A0A2LJC1_9FLAO|nr:hypothetical protein [Flavobacterium beibuense]KGO79273.1 hypothetical protein Q763_14645 [Flavobacterium beibuense F44-8]